jgi:hypothetical protein
MGKNQSTAENWCYDPRQKGGLLSRIVTPLGTKEGNFHFKGLPREIAL